jgi:hypothetical protein
MRKLCYRSAQKILCVRKPVRALWCLRAIVAVYFYLSVYFLVTGRYYNAGGFFAAFLLVRYGIRTTRDLHKK